MLPPASSSYLRPRTPGVFTLLNDVKLSVRRLARTPGWTFASAGTLALGLAAAIVAGVVLRDVLMRPLPFPSPERLVRLREVSENGRRWWPSYPNAADWREQGRMFSGVGIADIPRVVPVQLDGRAARVAVSRASRGLFETLGVQPAAGRLFTPDENRPGGAPVAVVSDRFWRTDFRSGSPGTATVTIGMERYTIVGILPPSFKILGDGGAWGAPADIWTPMDRDTNLGSRSSHGYHVIARLRDGVTLDQARAELNQLARTLKQQHGEPTQADSVLMTPLHETVVGASRDPVRLLLYAAVAVLLVSCLNLAAAVLAQGLNRERELSVRVALGATRWRLARHLIVEAATLALPATILGVLAAALTLRAITSSAGGTLPRLDEASIDAQAIALAGGLALLTALIAGLLPAVVLSRRTITERLRTHGASGPRAQRRLWTGFVVAQVMLTVVLLAGAGLLIVSFLSALSVDLGYRPSHVLAVEIALPDAQYAEPARRIAYYDAALDRLRQAAGIEAAGLTSALPHLTTAYTSGTSRDGNQSQVVMAGYRLVDRGYFDAIGIARLQGAARALDSGAVIDRRLADALWNGKPAIGDRVSNGFAREVLPVSGVVGTVREWNQGDDAIGVVYQDFHRRPDHILAMSLVVRYAGADGAARQRVAHALAAVDPLVPVSIESLEALTAESLNGRRLLLILAAGFGVAALLLAAAGVYAMVAFAVGRQLRDSAIRLALGAHPSSLGRRVVLQGVLPAAGGAAGAWRCHC